MKAFLVLILSTFTIAAKAEKIQQLNCQAQDGTAVHVIFGRKIEALKPFVGTYDFGATLQVETSRGTYVRADMRMSPLRSYQTPDMRGDAAGNLYLRLVPMVSAGGEFQGRYHGQLFVNDLEAKVYLNFRDQGTQPGLLCVVHEGKK